MASPADLDLACQELLTASIASLDTIPVSDATLLGAPDRAFVDFGQSALDCCDQLTVAVAQVTAAALEPGGLQVGRSSETMRLNHVYLLVTSTRCVPMPADDGTPPPPDDLAESARQLNADGWALWNHLYNLWMAGELFTLCGEVFWDAMRPIGPSGQCAGWVLSIHIRLDGYPEAIST